MSKIKKYYSARYDRIFKKIMLEEEGDYHLLEAILGCILESKVEILTLPRTELLVDTTEEKVKTRDLVMKLEGKYVNLEVETGHEKETKAKNFTYLCSMYKKNIVRKESYAIDTLFLQVILQYGLSSKNPLLKKYKMRYVSEERKEVEEFIDNFEILAG